jgi:hypothetical protein
MHECPAEKKSKIRHIFHLARIRKKRKSRAIDANARASGRWG